MIVGTYSLGRVRVVISHKAEAAELTIQNALQQGSLDDLGSITLKMVRSKA
jgi:hypothetical protein